MDNAFDQIRKKEEDQVYTHRIVFNTKEGEIYDSPPQKNYMNQYLLKWTKLFSIKL